MIVLAKKKPKKTNKQTNELQSNNSLIDEKNYFMLDRVLGKIKKMIYIEKFDNTEILIETVYEFAVLYFFLFLCFDVDFVTILNI